MAVDYDISNRWLRNYYMAIGETFNKLTNQKVGSVTRSRLFRIKNLHLNRTEKEVKRYERKETI